VESRVEIAALEHLLEAAKIDRVMAADRSRKPRGQSGAVGEPREEPAGFPDGMAVRRFER